MTRLTVHFAGGVEPLMLDAEPNDVRRFAVHFDKFIAGEGQTQRRFVLRSGGETPMLHMVYLDFTKVTWLMTEEAPAAAAEA